jgi:hypothetical protein
MLQPARTACTHSSVSDICLLDCKVSVAAAVVCHLQLQTPYDVHGAALCCVSCCVSCRPLEELQSVADGKLMYSNYRMEVIDPMLGLNALDSIMQVQ